MKTAIIDYGAGNVKSVINAMKYLGYDTCLTDDASKLASCDHIILPGVGAFGKAMDNINRANLRPVISKLIEEEIPFLGICLGLQLLFESSQESICCPGLSILEGKVRHIPEDSGLKIPHVGWDNLNLKGNGRLFKNCPDNSMVYFIHSYYVDAKDKGIVKSTCDYGCTMDVSIEYRNLFACQFHPEKSGETGLNILKNFMEI